MLRDSSRVCDVCGETMPPRSTYSIATLPPEKAAILLEVGDAELLPTWTQNLDGTVRLDVCLDCYMSMGQLPDAKKVS